MAGEFDPAIQRLVLDINEAEQTLAEKRRMVNRLCEFAGRSPMYSEGEAGSGSLNAVRADQFYGKPLATAIREVLEMRRASGLGAAVVREIFDVLKAGGFKFDAKDDDNAQRGLRQSLTKNSVTFHKLPNGTYGLVEWYPGVKPARGTSALEADADDTKRAAGEQSPPADPATLSDTPDDDQEAGVSEP